MGHSPLPRPLLGGEGDIPPRTLLPRHLRRLASRAFDARPPLKNPGYAPVRLHRTDYQKTFAPNLTSLIFENFLKLTILILRLTFNNCILSFYL